MSIIDDLVELARAQVRSTVYNCVCVQCWLTCASERTDLMDVNVRGIDLKFAFHHLLHLILNLTSGALCHPRRARLPALHLSDSPSSDATSRMAAFQFLLLSVVVRCNHHATTSAPSSIYWRRADFHFGLPGESCAGSKYSERVARKTSARLQQQQQLDETMDTTHNGDPKPC